MPGNAEILAALSDFRDFVAEKFEQTATKARTARAANRDASRLRPRGPVLGAPGVPDRRPRDASQNFQASSGDGGGSCRGGHIMAEPILLGLGKTTRCVFAAAPAEAQAAVVSMEANDAARGPVRLSAGHRSREVAGT